MAYTSSQLQKKGRVKVQETLRSAPFRKGFDEARAGKPFDYAWVDSVKTSEAWRYERGRLLATIYEGKLKTGNRVENGAIAAYKLAKTQHLIF